MKANRKIFALVVTGFIFLVILAGITTAQEEPVNINTADLEQLMTLERIGPQYAQRIIDYRKDVGPFEKPEDIINVPGIGAGELRLSADVLARIYLGQIKRWDAAPIKALNPKVKLPDKAITVVHRADGSGTTWIFTNYLETVSSTWADQVGTRSSAWPLNTGLSP